METIGRRENLHVRRLVLEPGEATPWHVDPCHRLSVVVRGEALAIEHRDGEVLEMEVSPGLADWEPPTDRVHRAVNVGRTSYEEVTVFVLAHPAADPQPVVG